LRPGQYCTVFPRGAPEHIEDPCWMYHGTSFVALRSILSNGFLGSYGAGRLAACERFGVDRPVVYCSQRYDIAKRYPMALASPTGALLGERVSADVWPLRVVISCVAPVSRRRIKLRRGPANQQDAFLPQDVSIFAITFEAHDAAPPSRSTNNDADEYQESGATEHDDIQDITGDHFTVFHESSQQIAAPVVESLASQMLVRLRIHAQDPRRDEDVIRDMLELAGMRRQFMMENDIQTPTLSRSDFQKFWNGPLYYRFLEDEQEYWEWSGQQGRPGKRAREHSRFGAWIRRQFGQKKMVCAIICYGLSQAVQTCLEGRGLQ